jgi:hypothetical protein
METVKVHATAQAAILEATRWTGKEPSRQSLSGVCFT